MSETAPTSAPVRRSCIPASFTRRGLLLGVRLSTVFTLGSLVDGVLFGALARQAGLGAFEAMLMSASVAAGTAQLVALELWTRPLPALAIVLTVLLVNLRHVVFGAALPRWFLRLPRRKIYGSAFFLYDESWMLAMNRFEAGERDAAVLVGSGAAMLVAWTAGTVVGHRLGSELPSLDALGFDFLVMAVLVAMLVGFWKGKGSLLPWSVAAGVAVVASWLLPGSWYILLGGIAGGVVGGLADAR